MPADRFSVSFCISLTGCVSHTASLHDPHSWYFEFICPFITKSVKTRTRNLDKNARVCLRFRRTKSHFASHFISASIEFLHCINSYAIVYKVKWTTMMKQVEWQQHTYVEEMAKQSERTATAFAHMYPTGNWRCK